MLDFEEFAKTVKVRKYTEKAISLQDWAKQNNIPAEKITLSDRVMANSIGALLFQTPCRTKAKAGKERAEIKKYFEYIEIQKKYDEAVGVVVKERPLEDKECDMAYVRCMYKRYLAKQSLQQ
jgi:hypothetical protein